MTKTRKPSRHKVKGANDEKSLSASSESGFNYEGQIAEIKLKQEKDLLEMENKLRLLILNLLEKPVNLMRE